MKRRTHCLAISLLISLPTLGGFTAISATAARAASLPDLIDQTKPSVVLVGSFGLMDSPRFGFRGTGFVVGDGRTVLTNAHVLPPENPERIDRSIAVQVWSPGGTWQMRDAKLLSRDAFRDLALLRIDGPAIKPLKLASTPTREGTAIALIGFPLGNALGFSHVTHRGIVASRTQVAAAASNFQALNERAVHQIRQGNFDILQLDANAYPGNSGGPVLDLETGEVVGVLNMVLVKGTKEAALAVPTGISYAVPASEAQKLLDSVASSP